jgi:hypothetical protein
MRSAMSPPARPRSLVVAARANGGCCVTRTTESARAERGGARASERYDDQPTRAPAALARCSRARAPTRPADASVCGDDGRRLGRGAFRTVREGLGLGFSLYSISLGFVYSNLPCLKFLFGLAAGYFCRIRKNHARCWVCYLPVAFCCVSSYFRRNDVAPS